MRKSAFQPKGLAWAKVLRQKNLADFEELRDQQHHCRVKKQEKVWYGEKSSPTDDWEADDLGLWDQWKDFKLYFNYSGKPLDGFKHGSGLIWFLFWKITLENWVGPTEGENGLK